VALDYMEGVKRCIESAKAHAGVAHQLRTLAYELGASKNTAGFAVSHAALAEEEAAKAAFCAMVAVELAPPEILDSALHDHKPKTYLYHALARLKILDIKTIGNRTTVTLSGLPIGAEILRELLKADMPELKEHNADRNAGFYVGKNDSGWMSPGEGCARDPMALVYQYLLRAQVVLVLCQVLLRKPMVTLLSNLRIEEANGNWTFTWDEI